MLLPNRTPDNFININSISAIPGITKNAPQFDIAEFFSEHSPSNIAFTAILGRAALGLNSEPPFLNLSFIKKFIIKHEDTCPMFNQFRYSSIFSTLNHNHSSPVRDIDASAVLKEMLQLLSETKKNSPKIACYGASQLISFINKNLKKENECSPKQSLSFLHTLNFISRSPKGSEPDIAISKIIKKYISTTNDEHKIKEDALNKNSKNNP